MRKIIFIIMVTTIILSLIGECIAKNEEDQTLKSIEGPNTVSLGTQATLFVPNGYVFIDGESANDYFVKNGEISNPNLVGLLADKNGLYELHFSYVQEGYVKDDDKNNIDKDAILNSIKEANNEANEERKKNGGAVIDIIGWKKQPYYNETNNNLEWALSGIDKSDNKQIINHDVRVLGRNGIMKIKLICNPDNYENAISDYREKINNFKFNEGNRYTDFRKGDKVSQYGLAALVTGGAVAVAAKTGILKYLWKFISIGVIAVGTFIVNIFKKKK